MSAAPRGWEAFDAATQAELARYARAGRDCFGEAFKAASASDEKLLEFLNRPRRPAHVAAHFSAPREEIDAHLSKLAALGFIARDGEGFVLRVN